MIVGTYLGNLKIIPLLSDLKPPLGAMSNYLQLLYNIFNFFTAARHSDTTTATKNTFRLMAKTKKGPWLREERKVPKNHLVI